MKNKDIYHEHSPELITLWRKSVELWGEKRQAEWYDHSMRRLLVFGTLLRRYKVEPEGMLYVGAHHGGLLWVWLMLGFRNVLMIEPQPEVFKNLAVMARAASSLSLVYDRFLACETETQIQLAQCAISDQDGEADLFVMSHSMLSSLNKPNNEALHQSNTKQDVSLVDCVKVPVRTLDSLLQELQDSGSTARYNGLYMNIQGSELNALKGATKALENLEFIFLENNFKDRYDGLPTVDEFDAFLGGFGFEAKWGMIQPAVGNGYTAYVKKRGA
ncbi:FkbM family methyltransferase [Cystobacter ferrugineus]|uniref:Methyltransferase FkbM domain-containing protein n=1 Tax=Cystobacter ferrugineus TaxID=83449 RepID=A0A1L9B713_9BACT|nr:FkbM family methyltransferase [Cystobacter ferrugineus]OJH38042.1 hypothetical protein BON30_23015 [Cystobacter ferrugineus]